MLNRKNLLYFLIFILFSLRCYAQKLSMDEVLRSITADEKIINNNTLKTFAQGLNYKLPFMRKIDVRFGINGNLTADSLDGGLRNEDYYAINLATNNWKEMKLQRAIQPAQVNVYAVENQVFLHQALVERYQSLANIYFSKQLYEKKSELLEILSSKTEILKITLNQGENIRIKDIVDIENDRNSITKSLFEYQNIAAYNQQKIKSFMQEKDFETIDFQNFITIDDIEKNLATLQLGNAASHPNILLRQAQRDLSNAEFKYENARDRQIFNFLQIGYDNYAYQPDALKRYNPQNNFTIRVGLMYPLPSNNNLKRSQAALQLREDEQAINLTEKLQQRAADNQVVKIESLIKNYRLIEKNIAESLVQKLLNNETLLQQISSLEVIEMKISVYKLKLQNFELFSEICTEYLRYLDLSGNISKYQDRNFLAR